MRRLIVEADGGSRGNPGPAAYGTVVRDAETGEVLAERAEHIGTASNNVAEYRGLIAGLLAAAEIDPAAQVEARLDSKLVVEQMSGRWQIKHRDMKPLALKARAILPPAQVVYTWVPREQNKHADRLANEALDAAARGQEWKLGLSPEEVKAASQTDSQPATPIVDEAEVEPPVNTAFGWTRDVTQATTFVMLRHGETAYTPQRRFSGSGGANPPLTGIGLAQAKAAGEALLRAFAERPVHAIVSSPVRRARETAEVVAQVLGLEVREVDGLRECAFGEWDGYTLAEVQQRWPDELTQWLGSTAAAPPGGESFDAVWARVRRARDQLLTRFPRGTVLVVSHVTPIKALVGMCVGAPRTALFRMELHPASFTETQWYADGGASLRLFNDTSHLAVT